MAPASWPRRPEESGRATESDGDRLVSRQDRRRIDRAIRSQRKKAQHVRKCSRSRRASRRGFRSRFPRSRSAAAGFVRSLFKLLLILSPLLVPARCLITYVAPDQIGLRQVSFGPSKGLQKTLVGAGLPPPDRAATRRSRRSRATSSSSSSRTTQSERGADHRTVGAINVPTVDGYPVAVDVTVIYRIADPFLVVSRFGFGRAYRGQRRHPPHRSRPSSSTSASCAPRSSIGDQRLVKARSLQDASSRRVFKENGIQLADILIRQYDYPRHLPVAHRAEEDSGPVGPHQPRPGQTGRGRHAAASRPRRRDRTSSTSRPPNFRRRSPASTHSATSTSARAMPKPICWCARRRRRARS